MCKGSSCEESQLIARNGGKDRTNLFDCVQAPCDRYQPEERVEIQTELRKGSAGAGEHRDEAVDARYFIEQLEEITRT